MAETVTSLFGGHRQPADRPPASWPTVQPAACLQSFGYATLTSSAPSCSTGPARRDTDDSLTSYLRRCRHSYRLRHRRSRPFNPCKFRIVALYAEGQRINHSITMPRGVCELAHTHHCLLEPPS